VNYRKSWMPLSGVRIPCFKKDLLEARQEISAFSMNIVCIFQGAEAVLEDCGRESSLRGVGNILYGKPSKEYPMHLALYQESEAYKAVIHTHSFYATVLSCYADAESHVRNLFAYTPYLFMQTKGNIPCVAYAPPGSDALFCHFKDKTKTKPKILLLKHHGIVAGAEDVYHAFDLIEEMESSAHVYAMLKSCPDEDIDFIPH